MSGRDRRTVPSRPQRLTDLRHTTAFRLSAGLTAVFVVAIFSVLWLVYAQTAEELDQRTDLTVVAKARMLATATPTRRMEMATDAMHDTTRRLEGIAVFDAAGHRLIGDEGLAPPFPLGRIFERLHGPRGAPVRALALPTADHRIVVVSRDNTPSLDLRARILAIMLISGTIAIAVALGAGITLSLLPMRRIRRLEATAARIAMGELDLRIAISRRGDEFDMIAGIINAMVEEIERLLRQVKGSTDAIAHDLRTPLSHLRNRLERIALLPAIAGAADGDAAGLLAGARDELDAVLTRFRALLRMSELEAMHRLSQFAVFDPIDMVRDVAELFEPLADERGIELVCTGMPGLAILGDDRLLFEAISNLVENAIKFSLPGGRIALGVTEIADDVAILVADDGPGIPPAERAHVLERFARGSASVESGGAGSGLGLSLVAVIVALHGYALYLDPANDGPQPGLVARIVAPRAPGAPGPGGR
jgi:signal transduction histidine kinase